MTADNFLLTPSKTVPYMQRYLSSLISNFKASYKLVSEYGNDWRCHSAFLKIGPPAPKTEKPNFMA